MGRIKIKDEIEKITNILREVHLPEYVVEEFEEDIMVLEALDEQLYIDDDWSDNPLIDYRSNIKTYEEEE